MQAVLVYNSRSGSAITLKDLKKAFKNAGIVLVNAISVEQDIEKSLQPYLGKKAVLIAAYGGDGTISHIANILKNTDALFAPLAGGTLNHFTKDLGIDQDLYRALEAIVVSKPRKVDLVSVNDRIVINNSSLGLYPSALQMRDEMSRKNIAKWPAAIISSFKAFIRYQLFTVTIDGETFRTPFVFVGNNDYRLEERLIGQRTRIDEGVLSAYTVACSSRLSLLKIFFFSFLRRLESSDEVKIWKAKELVIHTKRSRVRISRDGEHEKIDSPLHYQIIPGGLTILGGSSSRKPL